MSMLKGTLIILSLLKTLKINIENNYEETSEEPLFER